jgi:hypothetical protein
MACVSFGITFAVFSISKLSWRPVHDFTTGSLPTTLGFHDLLPAASCRATGLFWRYHQLLVELGHMGKTMGRSGISSGSNG